MIEPRDRAGPIRQPCNDRITSNDVTELLSTCQQLSRSVAMTKFSKKALLAGTALGVGLTIATGGIAGAIIIGICAIAYCLAAMKKSDLLDKVANKVALLEAAVKYEALSVEDRNLLKNKKDELNKILDNALGGFGSRTKEEVLDSERRTLISDRDSLQGEGSKPRPSLENDLLTQRFIKETQLKGMGHLDTLEKQVKESREKVQQQSADKGTIKAEISEERGNEQEEMCLGLAGTGEVVMGFLSFLLSCIR